MHLKSRLIVWLLGLHLAITSLQPALGVAVNNSTTKANEIGIHCVVALDNTEIRKDIGTIWVSSEDPCLLHACEYDGKTGDARETISRKDCGQFYCDVDSELQAVNGTCCGECVRNKCRYKDTYYSVGKTWRDSENCLLLECVQHAVGELEVVIYQKTCPPIRENCPPAFIYTKECCQHCRYDDDETFNDVEDDKKNPRVSYIEGEDTWTEEYYRHHPCARECQPGNEPMMCQYRFVIETFQSMSKACYDCPRNNTDCTRVHCILADGISRSVTVANRMMPGPAIEVCENDLVIVDVHNDLLGETTTIHWHGIHQKDNPYADGVPHVTQCPISPHSSFRYAFKADISGTHMWHSHTGMQRGDGLFGALIVRRPRTEDPHARLYDFDLSEHKMLVQDWLHDPGVMVFASHHHSRGDNKPRNLLINGRGRYYPGIWEEAKRQARVIKTKQVQEEKNKISITKPPVKEDINVVAETSKANVYTLLNPNKTFTQNIENSAIKKVQLESNAVTRLTRLVQEPTANISTAKTNLSTVFEETTTESFLSTGTNHIQTLVPNHREKRATEDLNLSLMPHQVYKVKKGFRYRFRIINGEYLNCPIAISIDKHNITVINSDGYDIEPVLAGSVVTYSGERWDFVLHANQPVGNYWIRLKGLMDCSDVFTSAFQVAILRYDTAPEVEPEGTLGWSHEPEGIEINSMNQGSGQPNSLTAAELRALPYYNTVPGIDKSLLKEEADYKFFIYYDFYPKDNPIFHPKEYYSYNDSLGITNKVQTPQLNHISLKMPAATLLSQRHTFDDTMFCNETSLAEQGIDCRKQFCYCHHMLQVPLNAVVEVIFVDEGFAYDANHPFHLHGTAFRVIGIERLGHNLTIETAKQLDTYGLLKRNLVNPPVKDTVTVPDGGYTIIRFVAHNPGYWLMHCHLEFHAEIGMAVVFKVGEDDQMAPVPKDFPTCSDYMPDMKSLNGSKDSAAGTIHSTELLTTIVLLCLALYQ